MSTTRTLRCAQRLFHQPQSAAINSAIIRSTFIRPIQQRNSSFLSDNTTPSPSTQTQHKTKTSWFRRRKDRTPRSKISTLAIDAQSSSEGVEEESSMKDQSKEEKQNDDTRLLEPRTRRLLIWTAVLTMPLWGRDILEIVVPGMLGVFIFVADRTRAGVRWVRKSTSMG